jgi:hypothetical protein
MLIVGILNLVMAGVWLGSIFTDRSNNRHVELPQYLWTIGCFLMGTYAIISCIGHAASVK